MSRRNDDEQMIMKASSPAGGMSWPELPALFRDPAAQLPEPWQPLFEPLRVQKDGLFVVAQLGQSLDGRIATASGHSHYINGPDGLAHLHRLRALVDAVLVGVGTAIADDPQLTVRRVEGPNPARIVIDPRGRLPRKARLLAADGVRRLIVTGKDISFGWPQDVELIRIASEGDTIAPADIVAALSAAGFRRVLLEGGANTISRFLAAGCIDRLHVVVAPVIVGSGPAGISLPAIEKMDEALRPPIAMHVLGNETLFDCDLSQRNAFGRANTSA
jgi:riboflavin-specific deaminase-like protein